jgi:hypothetical protein
MGGVSTTAQSCTGRAEAEAGSPDGARAAERGGGAGGERWSDAASEAWKARGAESSAGYASDAGSDASGSPSGTAATWLPRGEMNVEAALAAVAALNQHTPQGVGAGGGGGSVATGNAGQPDRAWSSRKQRNMFPCLGVLAR